MPDLRKDPITGRWVIISTERAMRPNDFKHEKVVIRGMAFCPFDLGNESKTPEEVLAYGRNGTAPNEPGWTLRVVPNQFPALRIEGSLDREGEGLYDRMNGVGAHEVIIETPDHQKTLAQLSNLEIRNVLSAYRERILDLIQDPRFRYVLIFKNHGEAAGASLEHSHSQLIALPIRPKLVREEMNGARTYYKYKERCVYCDIIRQEQESKVRVIAENDDLLAVTPYAPRFPFESWILPKEHTSNYEQSTPRQIENLAPLLKDMLMRVDAVLDHPPYNFVLHSSPHQESNNEYYHWHLELMPKLTRVAGFEWGTGFYINPMPPETSAELLREADLASLVYPVSTPDPQDLSK